MAAEILEILPAKALVNHRQIPIVRVTCNESDPMRDIAYMLISQLVTLLTSSWEGILGCKARPIRRQLQSTAFISHHFIVSELNCKNSS